MHFTFLRSNESRKCSSFTMVLTRKTVKSSRQKHKQNLKRASELSNISNGGKLNLLRRMYGRVYFRIIINNNFFPLLSPFFFCERKNEIGYKYVCLETYSYGIRIFMHSCIPSQTQLHKRNILNFEQFLFGEREAMETVGLRVQ